jgi:16S rRNA (uracil1498-N3)-methyltransferase
VLRLRAGDPFVAFDPETGAEADALVVGGEPGDLLIRVESLREGRTLPTRPITWIQAFAKNAKCDAVVRDATELGATRVIVATTKRSVVSLDGARGRERQARWARIAAQAARQSGRSVAPLVDPPTDWGSALAGVAASDARFCLSSGAHRSLGPALLESLADARPLAFACGPEGGLDAAELSLAGEQGWNVVTIGFGTLRTETVAAAVLGAVRVWSALFLG